MYIVLSLLILRKTLWSIFTIISFLELEYVFKTMYSNNSSEIYLVVGVRSTNQVWIKLWFMMLGNKDFYNSYVQDTY
jgi:hypothetical protein